MRTFERPTSSATGSASSTLLNEEALELVAGGRVVPSDAQQLEYDTIMDLIYWTEH